MQNKSKINLNGMKEDFGDKSQLIAEENKLLIEDLNEYADSDNRTFQSKITRTTQIRKLKKPGYQSEFKQKSKQKV